MAGAKERPFAVVWRDAIRDSGLTMAQKHVASTIASYFDGDASKAQRRGFGKIAADASMSRRAVIKTISDLERYGVIRVVRTEPVGVDKHGRPTRGYHSNTYELLPIMPGQLPPQTVHQVHRDSAGDAPSTVHEMHVDSAPGAPVLEEPSTRTPTSPRLEARARETAAEETRRRTPDGVEQEQCSECGWHEGAHKPTCSRAPAPVNVAELLRERASTFEAVVHEDADDLPF